MDRVGVDEFLLRRGPEHARLIVDMRNGHVLWIRVARRKQTISGALDFFHSFVSNINKNVTGEVRQESGRASSGRAVPGPPGA